ncbi:30S ribosomal protein S16 [Streptomyces rishiriensis]|uniref:30S ribosomal protein S16 n=1 Tax=Streptomyces rishiriensis TaxID=68264 RepID=UPI00340AB383
MAVKIKLKRLGKIRSPHYRIVIADSRTRRDGRAIEEIGKYQPTYHPSVIEVDADRVAYWLGVGAQPTEPVLAILKKTGDWQKFKGEPAPAPLLVAEPKKARPSFEALGSDDSAKGEAITQKKKAEKKDEAAAESSESTEA